MLTPSHLVAGAGKNDGSERKARAALGGERGLLPGSGRNGECSGAGRATAGGNVDVVWGGG